MDLKEQRGADSDLSSLIICSWTPCGMPVIHTSRVPLSGSVPHSHADQFNLTPN